MKMRLQDLDPEVSAHLMEQMRVILAKPHPSEAERRAVTAEQVRYLPQRADKPGHTLSILVAATLPASAFLTIMMLVTGGWAGWAWVPGAAWCLLGGSVGFASGFRSSRAVKAVAAEGDRVHHDLLAAWLPVVELPRLESAYWEAIQVLANDCCKLDEPTGREMLAQLNTLLARDRELIARRQSIQSVLNSGDTARLEEEREQLAGRVAAASDPIARAAMQESLRMCEVRIENVGKLKPALERLDAQQEAIVQTMASVQSALARWQAAPTVADLPSLEEVQQAVVRINDETFAVERAVQEVTAVGA
jgi:hypothetical protein